MQRIFHVPKPNGYVIRRPPPLSPFLGDDVMMEAGPEATGAVLRRFPAGLSRSAPLRTMAMAARGGETLCL